MNKLFTFLTGVSCLFLCGCGTNVFTELKAVGMDASVPVYGTVVGVRVGQSEITTAATRGNTTFTSQNTTGGGLFATTAGTGRVSTLSSGPMVNEGYVAEILTSKEVPEAAKVALVQHYLPKNAPVTRPATSKTIGAATGSGEHPVEVEPITTGVDKIVDKTAETIQVVTPPIANATKEVVNNTVDTAGGVANKFASTITVVLAIVFSIVVILILSFGPKLYKLIKTKLKKKTIVETVVEAVTHKESTRPSTAMKGVVGYEEPKEDEVSPASPNNMN